jgi:purine nucleoside phosphorylase
MKKLGFAIAALSAIALAAPSIANAETVIVKRGHPHWHHSRAAVMVHRGWHPHHDRTVIIRHGHGHRW